MESGDVVAGRFEIERVAGEGGMGMVFRARDLHGGGAVALKVMSAPGRDGALGDRFAREARLLAELSHPGIVRYVAHGPTGAAGLYLAMEWLDGEDLATRLARAGLTTAESVRLAARVAGALAAAHARGIIHRDVKPSNLFLCGGDVERVKIIDFGVARLGAGGGTRTGTALGTPGYMAPEQARGGREVDARADVFALGCVLFECLAGRPPFQGDHPMAVLAKILLDEAPRLGDVRSDLPLALDDLVARMLAKEPGERPPDGAAVGAELGALDLADGGQRARPSLRLPALTASENRLLSVVLAAATPEARVQGSAGTAATLRPGEDSGATITTIRERLARQGARVELLADGSLVATLWGTGVATDQATQAARIALALRAALPGVPMALATGRGDVSGRWPVGEVIDRAVAALGAAAPAGEGGAPIRLDDVTAGLLDARFTVGGDSAGLALEAEREATPFVRTLLGRPSSCVGRERELGVLRGVFDECVAEPIARAVLVTAPAGTGKSRLRYEFLLELDRREEPPDTFIARGDPMSAGSPFGLAGAVIRRAAGLADGEPLPVRRQKLRARVSRCVPEADRERVAAFLGEIVGTPFAEDDVQLQAARRDPIVMGDQIRRAWEDWIRAESAARPIVLVLEDLHWGDLPSVKLVDGVLRNLADRPILVLAAARPEVHELFPRLWADRGLQELRLGELTRRASEKLVRQVLGDGLEPALVARLAEVAGGNAFYLEELIRAVAEGKGDRLPQTVVAMAQARLERLEPEARRVLRAAAVFGQLFWRDGVMALLGGARTPQVSEWLDELVAREVIFRRPPQRFPGHEEFMFRHALVQEAAYAMLTDADRALGHRLAGEWLERAGETEAVVLAEHFERGGERARAAGWYRRAAEQALEGDDFAATIARARRGVALGAAGEAAGALLRLEARAHFWRGSVGEAEARGAEAVALLEPGGAAWFGAVAELLVSSGYLGRYDAVAGWGERAASVTAAPDAAADQAISLARAAAMLFLAGRGEPARALAERVEALLGPALRDDRRVMAGYHWMASLHHYLDGDLAGFQSAVRGAYGAYRFIGDARNAAQSRSDLGWAFGELGDYAAGEAECRAALEEADRLGLKYVAAAAAQNLARAIVWADAPRERLAEARELLERVLRDFEAQGDRRMLGAAFVYLSELELRAGDPAAAEGAARRALAASEEIPTIRCYGRAALARALVRRGDAAAAAPIAVEAARELEALGSIDEGEAYIALAHAEVLWASGDAAAARAAIARARQRLLTRAERITDAALRERCLERVPEHRRTLELAREWLDPR